MKTARIYGEVEKIEDITKINRMIRRDVRKAKTKSRLTELYNRSKYLVTLTYSPAWKKHFRGKILKARKRAMKEFEKTAKLINRRAKQLGIAKRYDVTYG